MSTVAPTIDLHHDLWPSKHSRDTQETKAVDVNVRKARRWQTGHNLTHRGSDPGFNHQPTAQLKDTCCLSKRADISPCERGEWYALKVHFHK